MHFKEIADFALWLENATCSDLISAISECENITALCRFNYCYYYIVSLCVSNGLPESFS